TFIILFRRQDNARDGSRLKANLTQTVAAISNQTNGDWRGISVANEGADLPDLLEEFSVVWVAFPSSDLCGFGEGGKE
ncbi:galactosyl transferase, partial [Rhizobium ruizarguesonis]